MGAELIFWALLSTALADPEPIPADPVPTSVSEPAEAPGPEPFGIILSNAKTLYFQGNNDEAAVVLETLRTRLSGGEAVTWALAAEALVYLGEIRHLQGRDDEARKVFRELLIEEPDHAISPYYHPMDVIGMYETVRRQVKRELGQRSPEPEPVRKRRPLPVWGYLPFGVPQARQGRSLEAVVYGSIQGAAAIGGVTVWIRMRQLNGRQIPNEWADEEVFPRIQLLRYGAQWPLTAAFYATWALSVADGAVRFRREQRTPQVTVGLAPLPGGSWVGAQGRF